MGVEFLFLDGIDIRYEIFYLEFEVWSIKREGISMRLELVLGIRLWKCFEILLRNLDFKLSIIKRYCKVLSV